MSFPPHHFVVAIFFFLLCPKQGKASHYENGHKLNHTTSLPPSLPPFTRLTPTGPPAVMAAFQSYWSVATTYRPFWRHFHYFPLYYFLDMVLHRMWREMYAEYQIHKILTWGQFEISSAKRRAGGAKEHATVVSERRSVNDYDGFALGHKNGTILPSPGSGYRKTNFISAC